MTAQSRNIAFGLVGAIMAEAVVMSLKEADLMQ